MIPETQDAFVARDTLVSIKRSGSDGIDGLFGYDARDVETTGTIEVVGSGNLPASLNEFVSLLESDYSSHIFLKDLYRVNKILDPSEVGTFVNIIKEYSSHEKFDFFAGWYTTQLIQNSYLQKNNNFKFDFIGFSLKDFGANLYGNKYDPLKISIGGNCGLNLGSKSHYLDVLVDGNVKSNCMTNSENCKIKITKNVENYFGHNSKNLVADIFGDVGYSFGYFSNEMKANLRKDVNSFEFLYYAKNSNIIFNDVETVKKVVESLKSENSSLAFTHSYDVVMADADLLTLAKTVTLGYNTLFLDKSGRKNLFARTR